MATGGVDGNDTITLFDITTKGISSRGRTEVSVGANDYTDLDLDSGTNTITRADGTDFVTDGFLVGMKIVLYSATEIANNGAYTIASVSTTEIAVEESITTTNATDASVQLNSALVQTATTGTGVLFALILGTNNEAVSDVANDEYSMHRTGTGAGNTTWRLNGVQFYAYAGALHTATDMGVCFHSDNTKKVNMWDGSIDYELNRRILRVGNGTTTGSADPNFRALSGLVGGTDLLRLYYDDGSGPVEFTYVTEGYTAPAANEVNVQAYSGYLWFHTDNATDTITGNWTITKRDNLT